MKSPRLAYLYWRAYMLRRVQYWTLGTIYRAWIDTTGKDQE